MKVTEKSLKTRCTELNLGILKDTGFGVRVERIGSSYTVSLIYRDSTQPEILLQEATAAEADACISGIATTTTVYKATQGTRKPEQMAQKMEQDQIVTAEELAISNSFEIAALVNLLERKGVLTMQELLEEIKSLRAQASL